MAALIAACEEGEHGETGSSSSASHAAGRGGGTTAAPPGRKSKAASEASGTGEHGEGSRDGRALDGWAARVGTRGAISGGGGATAGAGTAGQRCGGDSAATSPGMAAAAEGGGSTGGPGGSEESGCGRAFDGWSPRAWGGEGEGVERGALAATIRSAEPCALAQLKHGRPGSWAGASTRSGGEREEPLGERVFDGWPPRTRGKEGDVVERGALAAATRSAERCALAQAGLGWPG